MLKKHAVQSFLEKGKIVIIVNSNVQGVVLPNHLMNKIQVKLSLSLKFKNPTYLLDDLIQTQLTFNGITGNVLIPYTAIYGLYEDKNPINSMFWEDDVPAEIFELADDIDEQISKLEKFMADNPLHEKKENILDFSKEIENLKGKNK